ARHFVGRGSRAQVRPTAYSTASGATVYVDRMTAANPDDLERVLARLAKGLATGRPGAETAELDTVTQTEMMPALKRTATQVWGLGLGVRVSSDGEAVPGMSAFWLYDARSFMAELSFGFHHADYDKSDLTAGVGAYSPFGQSDFAPYVGGGARWASTNYSGETGKGIQLFAAVGGILGRLSSVQLRGQLEYFVDTFSSVSDSLANYEPAT